jgi:hypothetical protein
MHEDVFLTCLIEAETLAESRGSTYRDKHILGMYRNYSFEKNIDHLLERVLKSEFPIIKNHFWRYLSPVIQCRKTTARMVEKMGNKNFSEFVPDLCDALITKDLTEHEEEIYDALSKSIHNETDENFLAICKLICRKTTHSYRELLLECSKKLDLSFSVEPYFSEALGYQLTLDDLEHLCEVFDEELEYRIRLGNVQHLGFTKAASILVERHLDSNSLEKILNWLSDDTLRLISIHILGKLGNKDLIPHLQEILNDDEADKASNAARIAISMISNRESILLRINMLIEGQRNFEKILLKGGISGISDTNFFGYYTGIDRKKILSTEERRRILKEIFQTDFVFSSNEIPIRTMYQFGTKQDKRRNSLANLLGNLQTRQEYATRNIEKRPWHPQGLYTYTILSQDAKWLADEYGGELGISVGIIPTNIPGVYSFRVYNLNGRCTLCHRGKITVIANQLNCTKCGAIFPDSEQKVVFSKIINSTFVKLEGPNGGYKYDNSEVSDEDLKSLLEAYPVIIESQIPQFSNHMAAIYADIEEMLGVSGDSRDRFGLE